MADEQKQTTEELNDSQVGLLAADAEETKDETPDLREKTLNSQGEEEVELQEKPSTPAEGEKEGEEKKENENESDESKKEEPKDKTKQQLKEEEKAKKAAEKKAKEEEKKQKKEEEKKKEALKKEEEKKRKEEEKKAKEEAKKAAKEAKLEKKAAAETEATPEGEAEEGAEAVTKQPRKFQKPAILTVQRDDDRDTRHVNDVVKVNCDESSRTRMVFRLAAETE
ncbi:PREDICTED: nucleolar protein 58-like, partial [Priapulus caudatus]|uniref:Nucleolar protein 58-like n=1 Tax=Priapulus caudatus TaxID=37621 RepID=A0ABM1F4U0_PRICU